MTVVGDVPASVLATVPRWTGREVRELRLARRMSVRGFAAHLGVSDRMVSKWEAGGAAIQPRPVNQEALDTSLARASDDVKARFAAGLAAGVAGTTKSSQSGRAGGGSGSGGTGTGSGGCATGTGPPNPRGWSMPAAAVTTLVVHPADGKLMTLVDGGPVPAGKRGTRVWVSGFFIDVYPTTNAEYARFVAVTGRPAPAHWPAGRCPEALHDHPVVGVSWSDAQSYAAWAAKALPTVVQWEKAARGPSGAPYPWGRDPFRGRSNVRESGIGTTTPVDRYPDGISAYGVFDMCGNVWEWCATSGAPGRRAIRGGSFATPASDVIVSGAADEARVARRGDLGFRCVADLDAVLGLISI